MKKKEGLWDEYCSFFEKDFEEQLRYNRDRRDEFFERWKKTKTADHLLPEGAEDFEDVPVTTYEDYPALQRFGREMEKRMKKNPKPDGMLWKDYYERIGSKLKDWIEDWIPGEYGASFKTSGTTGKPKWFPMGKEYIRTMTEEEIAMVVFSCSEEWGETDVERGDVISNMGVPVAYVFGHGMHALKKEFKLFPPIEFTDNQPNMNAKLKHIIKKIQEGKKIDVLYASTSQLQLLSQALVSPEDIYEEYYKNMKFGLKKLVAYLLYLKEDLKDKDIERAEEVLPIKGTITGGMEVKLYKDHLTEQYGSPPLQAYGSTELGFITWGRPGRKLDRLPVLNSTHFEFMDEGGELHQIDDLNKGEVYKVIGTPFGTPLVRYDQKDLLSVEDFRDDGMPIFRFEGREKDWLDIGGYVRFSERMAYEVMKRAGFQNMDRWAVTKKADPDERLCFFFEEDKKEGTDLIKRLYRALYDTSEDFRSYISDFNIQEPSKLIDVVLLSRGSFRRYSLKKMNSDTPIGQYKPPKIIPPEDQETIRSLRRA